MWDHIPHILEDVLSPAKLPMFCRFDPVKVVGRIGSDNNKHKIVAAPTPCSVVIILSAQGT